MNLFTFNSLNLNKLLLPLVNHRSLTDSFSFFNPKKPTSNFPQFHHPSSKSSRPKNGTRKRNRKNPGTTSKCWSNTSGNAKSYPITATPWQLKKILKEDPVFEEKQNLNEEEIKENEQWWKSFRESPVVKFIARAEEIADYLNEVELKKNDSPYRPDDKKLWQALPHVIGLNGRPMPRKAIKTKEESDVKFWDFMKQFKFGLWGFRHRPYPPGRPIDVAQAVGYKRLEKRYYDFRLGAAATAFLHELQKGIPPWVPLKGRENKNYKQLQQEAMESKRRDQAVLKANGGVWPGVRIPSHALFLWASGSELTKILEADHMPNKFIPKDLRLQLSKIIPGLRPWEVLSVEQAMDQITYDGEWYREPLGFHTTGPPYIREWNRDLLEYVRVLNYLRTGALNSLLEKVPGFNTILDRLQAEYEEKEARREKRTEELIKEKQEKTDAMIKAKYGPSPYYP